MLTKKTLYQFLEKQNNFNKEVDGWIVDEFLYTLGLIRKVKKQIRNSNNALIINVSKNKEPDKAVMQPSPEFASYKALVKQALEISKHIPVTPKARKELAQEIAEETDGFNI